MRKQKKKIRKYPNGGFDANLSKGLTAGLSGIAGMTNSKADYKQDEQFDVGANPLVKGAEAALGTNPITSAILGASKIGESLGDSLAPGLGEGLFSPHKGLARAFKEGKPEYAIPVVGSVLAAEDTQKKLGEEESKMNRELNPYGERMLRNGGELMKYDAPTHEDGGQMITKEGVPTNNPGDAVAEIEKKETMQDGYVFSDTLKHKSGKTFAAVSKMLDSKFKSKTSPLDSRTKNFQMDMLKSQNEVARSKVEDTSQPDQFPNGGTIDPKTQAGQVLGGDLFFSGAEFDSNQLSNLGLQAPGQVTPLQQAQGNAVTTPNPLSVGLAGLGSGATVKNTGNALSQGLAGLNSGATVNPVLTPTKLSRQLAGLKSGATVKQVGQSTNKIKPIISKGIEQTFTVPGATPLGSEDTTPKDTSTEVESKDPVTGQDYLTPARVGKGIELAGKASILGEGYDRVNPELNPNARKVASLLKNRRVDNQALLNQINSQRNAALAGNNNARSLNVKRALDQRTYNAAARQGVQAKLQESTQNNAYRAQEAQSLSQLGSEEARANVYADDATARNKGQYLTNLGTVLGDVGRAGAFESKVKVNDIQVAESLALLGSKYENFGIDATTYERLKKGNYTLKDVDKLQEGLLKYKQ